MKRLRVAVLTHEELIPPDSVRGLSEKERQPFKRELGVADGLRELGHEVRFLGVSHELTPIRSLVEEWKPHVVFNLLMEFQDVGFYQVHVTSYLELLNVPYTGCNPAGLLLTRDKVTCKKILRYHRIPSPRFAACRRGRRIHVPKTIHFPLIVKSADEEASLGISQASIVRSEDKLEERVLFMHESVGTDAIVEEYVEGRELTVSVLGNQRLTTFPPWELFFKKLPEGSEPIATEKVKWDLEYQKRVGIDSGRAEPLGDASARRIAGLARRIYRAFGLSGYARVDLRLTKSERIHVIEVNAAPDITFDEDFAESAKEAGIAYPQLLQRILNLALGYRPPWKRAA